MNDLVQSKLEELRADYNEIKGQQFRYFYCPILFRDDDEELCKAHIVNQAFPDTARNWTIQRKDVDNFYGSMFEADFVKLQYRDSTTVDDILVDKELTHKFRPGILVGDKRVEHFVSRGDIPEQFTPLSFELGGETALFGLKISPSDFATAMEINPTIIVDTASDLRIPALVSLIKAAHLTLFEMLGYRYALSVEGHHVGYNILGKFFLENQNRPKAEVVENASLFFKEFVHMVRPVQENNPNFQGTITDKLFLICRGYSHGSPNWAFIVFIKTANMLHSVMIPMFEHVDAVATFQNFLQNTNENIEVNFCRYIENRWEFDPRPITQTWPKKGIFSP